MDRSAIAARSRSTVQPGEVTLVYSNTTPTTIRDRSKTTSTINVPDAMTIVDVNVQLNISHTRDQDLDVYLMSPDGTRVELFTDVGGNGDHFTGTILDDQASVSITAGSAPFAGTYRPEGSLAAFNGKNAAGHLDAGNHGRPVALQRHAHSWSITLTGDADGVDGRCVRCGFNGRDGRTGSSRCRAGRGSSLCPGGPSHANVERLEPIHVYVSDLPPGYLGLAWGQSLTLDVNANGAAGSWTPRRGNIRIW